MKKTKFNKKSRFKTKAFSTKNSLKIYTGRDIDLHATSNDCKVVSSNPTSYRPLIEKTRKIKRVPIVIKILFYVGSFGTTQFYVNQLLLCSVTRKKLPNVYKSCPKMINFETFTKIAWECERFGQINCCERL